MNKNQWLNVLDMFKSGMKKQLFFDGSA